MNTYTRTMTPARRPRLVIHAAIFASLDDARTAVRCLVYAVGDTLPALTTVRTEDGRTLTALWTGHTDDGPDGGSLTLTPHNPTSPPIANVPLAAVACITVH